MEVEPFDQTQLEDLGLNTCSHDLSLSSWKVPSVDEPEPQTLPNFPSIDVNPGDKRGTDPPSNPYSPDSFRMKEVILDKESPEVLRFSLGQFLDEDLRGWGKLVPSCCVIFDLEPFLFDFVFNSEIFKSFRSLAETSRTLGESNSIQDSCLVAHQNKQTKFERYKAFNDYKVDYDKLERKLNETLGLLAQKDIDIKEGLKLKAYEISVVQEKHNEVVKLSLLTKSHYEGLVKEKTKVIMDLKLSKKKILTK
ncbi:hypothetical protein Tco_0471577 [Tanacetum coccineum]